MEMISKMKEKLSKMKENNQQNHKLDNNMKTKKMEKSVVLGLLGKN